MSSPDCLYIPQESLDNYLEGLVAQFFKILPLKENGEASLNEYMKSLKAELMGCGYLYSNLNYDSMFTSLLGILTFLIENECTVREVKREVFKAISICKKLKAKYGCKECD